MHDDASHHQSSRNIKRAFFLNLAFLFVEIVGALYTNSLSILSDALHDIGDSTTLGIAWYLEKLSHRKGDSAYSYGYKRFSVLGAFINSAIFIFGSLFILSRAIERLMHPQVVHAKGMLALALADVCVNGLAALQLRQGKSLNEKVASWHFVDHVLSGTAVLIVSVILLFQPVYILDPILSIVITIYVVANVFRNLKSTVNVFLQGVPEKIDIEWVDQKLRAIPDVVSVHDTHIWTMDGTHHVMTAHIVVADDLPQSNARMIKLAARNVARELEIGHITLEIEYVSESCKKEGK